MIKKIAIIKGDGIGPDIIKSAMSVLDKVAKKFGHQFNFVDAPIGGNAYDVFGDPLPLSSVQTCLSSDAVLLGAVGGFKWDNLPLNLRPEAGLLGVRKALKLYANIRPAKLFAPLKLASPLNEKVISDGIDLVIIRELTGGIYFGERGTRQGALGREAFDTECYSEIEIERVARVAFEIARKRKKSVLSVDKANVLESSRLWRKIVSEVHYDYQDVILDNMFVDNCAMQLIKNPSNFDVVLTSNMFGDILSDLTAMMTGSIGLLPSASLGDTTLGLYEPIHGSAPDIENLHIANPIGTILAAAMMLRYSFDMENEALAIELAVEKVLEKGNRTKDIATDENHLDTCQMTDEIIRNIV